MSRALSIVLSVLMAVVGFGVLSGVIRGNLTGMKLTAHAEHVGQRQQLKHDLQRLFHPVVCQQAVDV